MICVSKRTIQPTSGQRNNWTEYWGYGARLRDITIRISLLTQVWLNIFWIGIYAWRLWFPECFPNLKLNSLDVKVCKFNAVAQPIFRKRKREKAHNWIQVHCELIRLTVQYTTQYGLKSSSLFSTEWNYKVVWNCSLLQI